MTGDRIPTTILSIQEIPNGDAAFLLHLAVPQGHRSLGLITTDCDDVSYAALDEATKRRRSRWYMQGVCTPDRRMPAPLWRENLSVSSRERTRRRYAADWRLLWNLFVRTQPLFPLTRRDRVVYFAHCISRSGSYLSREAGVEEGTPIAYLIAPPVEAMVGLDAALKAADVTLQKFYGPPTETNFAGGLLAGSQAACRAACEAFADAVRKVAQVPQVF